MNDNEQGQQRPPRTNDEFLKDNLKFLGFGDGLNGLLDQNLAAKSPSFSLDTTMLHGSKRMDFKLNFKQGREGDRYFFNNYEATLSHTNANGGPIEKKQTFYIDKGKGFTAKEAFNLLEGRAVHREMTTKEQVPYMAWVKLDLENPLPNGQHKPLTFGDDHGKKVYSLNDELSRFSIREMDNPNHREWLVKGLERGNLQQVNMVRGEKKVNDAGDPTNRERVTFVAAEPRYKSINVYDEGHNKLFIAQANTVKQEYPMKNIAKENPEQQQKTAQPVKQMENTKKTEIIRVQKSKGRKM